MKAENPASIGLSPDQVTLQPGDVSAPAYPARNSGTLSLITGGATNTMMPQSSSSSPNKTVVKVPESSQSPDATMATVEPYQDVETISGRNLESRINVKDPRQSAGLSQEEARIRQEKYGKNMLTPPKQVSLWVLFFKQFLNLFMVLLNIAGILSLVAYFLDPVEKMNLYLAIALFVIVSANCFLSFLDERSTLKVMGAFKNLLPSNCQVVRDGKVKEILAEDLVVGDFVWIRNGSKVPADLRLLHSSEMKVECSSITGESEPIHCTDEKHLSERETPYLECKNVAFNGSLCLDGSALGIVIATGDNTVIGKIANMASSTATKVTTMEKEVQYFVYFIAVLAITMATVFFVIGIIRSGGENIMQLFVSGFLVVVVANIPQGLPATVTSLLTITARRMAKKNVFVKRLDCVETLGSTSLIATDKTGTLTKNEMTLTDLWLGGNDFVEGDRMMMFVQQSLKQRHDAELLPGTQSEKFIAQLGQLSETASIRSLRSAADFSTHELYRDRNILTRFIRVATLCNSSTVKVKPSEDTRIDNLSLSKGRKPVVQPAAVVIQMTRDVHDEESKTVISRSNIAPSNGRRKSLPSLASIAPPLTNKDFTGNPSDIALLRFCMKHSNTEKTRAEIPVAFEIPFNSTNKWQLAIVGPFKNTVGGDDDLDNDNEGAGSRSNDCHQNTEEEEYELMLKGAPEVVMKLCTSYCGVGNEEIAVDDKFRCDFQQAYEHFASSGRRVIAVARKKFSSPKGTKFSNQSKNFPLDGLSFIAMAAIMDPPRDDVPYAIEKCKRAGIKVFMVTGDHPLTASAIARQIHLLDQNSPTYELLEHSSSTDMSDGIDSFPYEYAVIHGSRIPGLTSSQWDRLLTMRCVVFARTTPQHKLMIVKACQQRGEIVAVTGDGVNDAPALKQADVGVAMGCNGSDVAREAADILLTDDNFSSIVHGVEAGRVIFDNLKKTIAYTLTHLWPEITPVLITLALGLPSGMTSLQILSIDLGTELGPAISIAYETAESDIMSRPPRNPKTEKLMSLSLILYSYILAGSIEVIGCFIAYASTWWNHGITLGDLLSTSNTYWHHDSPDFCFNNFKTMERECIDSEKQMYIGAQATSAWYIAVIMGQAFHIWMCKTRRLSLFTHGLASNVVMFYGVALEIFIMIVLTYVPAVQEIMGAGTVGWEPWVCAIVSGSILWIYNESIKYLGRKAPVVLKDDGQDDVSKQPSWKRLLCW